MKKFFEEFKAFAMRGNVLDMAVGVVIGGAFGKITGSLVNDIIMPLISMITGGIDFTAWKWVLKAAIMEGEEVVKPEIAVNFGSLIAVILDFIIIAFAVFCMLKAINAALDKAPYCASHHYISKDAALKEMQQAMGTDPSMFLGYNPFYASVSMKMTPEYACSDSLQWISKKLTKMDGVSKVSWQENLMDLVNRHIRKVAVALLLLAVILSLVSFALINNTIKLTIYSKRFVMYSMKLVGAKWSFIRKPFLIRNLWIGLVSGLLTVITLWAAVSWASAREPWLEILRAPDVMLPTMAVVIGVGLVITGFCALRSVNRFLRMKAGDLHTI